MKQELIDRMVTGSPILDPRAAVEVSFRNYERSIAAPLKSVLDREWKDEDLYTVAQIAANAITYRDRELASLKRQNEALKAVMPKGSSTWWYESSAPVQKPLMFGEECNEPCTAELEVRLRKLAKHFEMRAKENHRRANREERKADTFQDINNFVQHDRSGYYFDGKAYSYERAAAKIREVLGIDNLKRAATSYLSGTWIKPKPQVWITEYCVKKHIGTPEEFWTRSGDSGVCEEFPSEAEALAAIKRNPGGTIKRRARRIA